MFNHWALFDALATADPTRECVVFRDRRLNYGDLRDRACRLANFLLANDVTIRRPRAELAGWESGQDHVGLYLHNGNEYLEGMLGAYAARAVSFNVNYRYVEEEMAYLLDDAGPAALVYHAAFAPTLAAVLPRLARQPLLVQVADESGHALLPGAVDYEEALAASSPATPPTEPSPEDLYVLYTGGTTGMPKGTLWTQADLFEATLRSGMPPTVTDWSSVETVAKGVLETPASAVMPMPPLMHGAAQWVALLALLSGSTTVIQSVVDHFDAADVLRTMEREDVVATNIVGDAFARPLCDELERGSYKLALTTVVSGGAVLSTKLKERLLALLPGLMIVDAAGSSESGTLLNSVSAGDNVSTGVFVPAPSACVLDEGMTTLLEPGHEGVGWLARRGSVPLGYLGDQAKTERTFPTVGDARLVVPGDRVRLRADGLVELLGRDSVTINSGGEKIFAEEVEQAVNAHPSVEDVLVVGRPSERWGQEVVAVVALRAGASASDEELLATAAEAVARYKLPKEIVRVDKVRRSPSGKADYAWARDVATGN